MNSEMVITKAPCAHCPFRKDRPIYLRRSRRIEIAEALLSGGQFPCHETVEWEEDDDGEEIADESEAVMCAGAAKALLQVGIANQMMRIAERLDLVNLEMVEERGPEVWSIHDWQELAEGSTGDDPQYEESGEPCNTVNDDCLAPAGYLMDGGVIYGTEVADAECVSCGEPVCSNCISEQGNCGSCVRWEEDHEGEDG